MLEVEEEKRALELIDLMKRAGFKGTYNINGEIDGISFDVVWKKYCHNETVLSE